MDPATTPAAISGKSLPTRWALIALVSGALAHVGLSSAFHLSIDEAHYALYAFHLDWSYFDHPPLVGWVQWLALQTGGSDGAMRLGAGIAWLLTAWALATLTERLRLRRADEGTTSAPEDTSIQRLSIGIFVLCPMTHVLGLALLPDTLLLPLVGAVMLVTWSLCQRERGQGAATWLCLGALVGLAGLAKYTAVLLGVGALLALAAAHGLALFRQRGFWLAVAAALILISPVVHWNYTHDWISFSYQLGHASGSHTWGATRLVSFTVIQLIGYGLLIPVGALLAILSARRNPTVQPSSPPRPSPALFCACFGVPPLLLFATMAGRGSALPHWTAPSWVALIPLAAIGWAQFVSPAARFWHKLSFASLAALQVAAIAGLFAALLLGGWSIESGEQALTQAGQGRDTAPNNPFADVYGWDLAARRATQLAAQFGTKNLAVSNWTLASRIAWYARPMPVKLLQRRTDQFRLWFGDMQQGESALVVDSSLLTIQPPQGSQGFAKCRNVEQMPVVHLGRQIAHFNFLLCQDWQGSSEPSVPFAQRR